MLFTYLFLFCLLGLLGSCLLSIEEFVIIFLVLSAIFGLIIIL